MKIEAYSGIQTLMGSRHKNSGTLYSFY